MNLTDGEIPISYDIPFDYGKEYYYGWISYIIILILGVIFNAVALGFMFFNEKISKLKVTKYLSYLAIQDFGASITCLIQCLSNLISLKILGDTTACVIESWQVVFFIGISGFSVCFYGFYLREETGAQQTKYVKDLDKLSVLRIHLVAWSIYALIAFLASYWPGRSKPMPSGTFCMPAYDEPLPAIFFFGIIIFPCVIFLLNNYYVIYRYYIRIKKNVSNIQNTNVNQTRKLFWQFSSFVCVYCFFYLPFVISACYEWATQYYSPTSVDFFSGTMAHSVSMLNPIMYVLTNSHCRREIKKIFRRDKNQTK